MSVEAIKEQARRHEQNEEWQKALDLYMKAIDRLSNADTPDIGLFNRAGDLATRIGTSAQAVSFYERAADYYVEAGLPNNAIAVCKKVIRNLPDRYSIHLKIGQIRAAQGFITDARASFVMYAERVQADGDIDEALRALIEFVDLAPDDYEIRRLLAAQLGKRNRVGEAVQQLVGAHGIMMGKGMVDEAAQVEAQIRRMDPKASLDASAGPTQWELGSQRAARPGTAAAPEGEDETEKAALADLPLIYFDDLDEESVTEEAVEAAVEESVAEETVEVVVEESVAEEAVEAVVEESVAEEAVEAAVEESVAEAKVEEAASDHEALAAAGDFLGAIEALSAVLEAEPDDQNHHQRTVEYAFRSKDSGALAEAYLGLAECLQRAGQETRAKAVFEQALSTDPTNERAKVALAQLEGETVADAAQEVASAESYVDLGAMLLGDEDEKTTRFVVAYEEPTGDESADFQRMLSQFREKVSENIGADDVTAHCDLGTAFKEMGLLDEAIAEYQQALRASADHLATYELLGQTFLEKKEPEAAVRSLTRALDAPYEVEDELIGIYYYLGVAHETVGNKDQAVEFYDRVFSLDINFADVTERLRALRD